jgi:hypothetical protein
MGELGQGIQIPVAVHIAIILANCAIRLAAIIGGIYVAKLGHDTMVRNVQGGFTYEGMGQKLTASIPGPLFILLGVLAVGWALNSPVQGSFQLQVGSEVTQGADGGAPPAKGPNVGENPIPLPRP